MTPTFPSENDGRTPADIAVDIIKRELPGFAAEVHAQQDRIRVRGPIYFNSYFGFDIIYPVSDTRDYAEAVARELVEKTRRHGIEQLGLETVVVERERVAFDRGRSQGYHEGRTRGIAQGRADMLAEVLAAVGDDEEVSE